MGLFEQHVMYPMTAGLKESEKGYQSPLRKFGSFTGNLEESGSIIGVGGRPGSGKKSYVDFVYVLHPLIEWRDSIYEKDSDGKVIKDDSGYPMEIHGATRKQLKITYFSNKTPVRIKIQKLLCAYIAVEHQIIMDIATLNSKRGQMFGLDHDTVSKISQAHEFFELVEKEVLTIIDNEVSGTEIKEFVVAGSNLLGAMSTSTGRFKYKKSGTNIVVIEDADSIATEKAGFTSLDSGGIKANLSSVMRSLKKTYSITCVLGIPVKSGYTRTVMDTEPNYKDLGAFKKVVDLGIILYNPYNEKNFSYGDYPVEDLVIRGKDRFRSVSIVSNSVGRSNVTVGCIFLGECGTFGEASGPADISWFEKKIAILQTVG